MSTKSTKNTTKEAARKTAAAPQKADTKNNEEADEKNAAVALDADKDDDDGYIDVRIRVPKANAMDLLKSMMSEYSEDMCAAGWGSEIDIEIDADARKRLAPGGNVARHGREMLNVALAQIHQHCGGWWSDRTARGEQQRGFRLTFYPMDEWVALPVSYDTLDQVAYPNPVVEEEPECPSWRREPTSGAVGVATNDENDPLGWMRESTPNAAAGSLGLASAPMPVAVAPAPRIKSKVVSYASAVGARCHP